MTDHETSQPANENALSVVDRVLSAFTKAIGEDEAYAEIAKRMRATLLDKRDISEAALERALFEIEQQ